MDLGAATVVTTVRTTLPGVFDVVADDYGRAFAFPAHSSDHARTINFAAGTDASGSSVWTSPGTKAKLVPKRSPMKLYGAVPGSPGEMEAYAITGGTANWQWSWKYDYEHDHCGDLWTSAENQYRIYTRCGEVFQPGTTAVGDMIYAGRIGNAALASGEQLAWVSESVAADELAALTVPAEAGGDPELRTYVATTMAPASSRTLAKLGVAGVTHATHGRFVFHRSDGTERYVLVSIDDAGGLASNTGLVLY